MRSQMIARSMYWRGRRKLPIIPTREFKSGREFPIAAIRAATARRVE
jgi:hypothetical protein